jgi:hypothetical protein
MIKYHHSKQPYEKSVKEKKKRLRIADSHKTVEQGYGTQHPNYGGSLGAAYDKATGSISKTHRADSRA